MAKLIGTKPNQVPTNADLGSLAYQDKESVVVDDIRVDGNVLGNLSVSGNTVATDFLFSDTNNLPETRPSLALNLMGSHKLDPRFVVTRASTATYVGRDGYIHTAELNEPRFDYDPFTLEPRGLLVEEARTNLFTHSEDFTQAQYNTTGVTVTPGSAYAPDDTETATKITQDSTDGNHVLYVNDGTGGNFSIFVKKAESRYVFISKHHSVTSGENKGGIVLDLDTGNVTETIVEGSTFTTEFNYSVEPYTNGWYRVYVGITTLAYGSWFTVSPVPVATGNSFWPSYQGDGTSGVYIWGLQSENNRYPTSYIPTNGSTATRSFEAIVMDRSYIDDDIMPIRRAPASVFIEYSRHYNYSIDPNTDRPFAFYYSTTNNSIQIRGDGSANEGVYVVDGGTTWQTGSRVVPAKDVVTRVALGWDYTVMTASFDGSAVSNVTMGIPFSSRPTELSLGSYAVYSSTALNGHVRVLNIYSKKLSDAELIALSKE